MLLNRDDLRVAEKLQTELAASVVAAALCDALDCSPEPFELDPDASGFDVRACAVLPSGVANRARLKVFSPRPDHTLVFFYKKSQVPFSRDRYSYGGMEVRKRAIDANEVTSWIRFIGSGFHPDSRPASLRRAFPYEIPD